MKPSIVLDKSTFQGLSPEEASLLGQHYLPVVTTELFMEIIGDLKKPGIEHQLAKKDVTWLSKKLLACDPIFSMRHEDLFVLSLLGYEIPLTTEAVKDRNLIKSLMSGYDPFIAGERNREKLTNWANGNFTKRDEIGASLFRNSKNPVRQFEIFKEKLKDQFREIRQMKSHDEVVKCAKYYLLKDDQNWQEAFFTEAMDSVRRRLPKLAQEVIHNRWWNENYPALVDFAPYAGYVYLIDLIHGFGIIANSIPTNGSFIDKMYLYYLPFCQVFSSKDNFHKNYCPFLLSDGQKFIHGELLKDELRGLVPSCGEFRN